MWPFKKRSSIPTSVVDSFAKRLEREREAKRDWNENLQCLFHQDGNEVVIVRGQDIECLWIDSCRTHMWKTMPDGHVESNPDYIEKHMMRTKSGQVFELRPQSWFKCRFEDASYGNAEAVAAMKNGNY